MFANPFPARLDNAYRGRLPALWLLGLLAAMKLAMGVNCMIQPAFVAATVDHIPLDSYDPAAAQTVIVFFAVWGLGQALLALLAILALVRYRTMVPIVFLLLLLEQVGRKLLFLLHPVATSGEGGISVALLINLGFLLALILGLVLSLWVRPTRASAG
ncbi:heme/copper-type cytochrome/quinol oxidase subunit 4 [Caulobacter ginsengisoli]|uniref:Heme/copper-type cytochrome/quinol oxidase subunit 4 n=1 Tax=Caulobacter ginsengisoli TaxID=400775 RepID=A0ABU0J000_9CAUL|nr:hypothetical protein [Caulobacter ginsengisoli]MDQ0466604.1 heme/copper-type cytochrome/quinol oxidase subunit 4 [Caulobacter ginsengisoli]